jgi:hypothetical protein
MHSVLTLAQRHESWMLFEELSVRRCAFAAMVGLCERK